ncbi:Arrestin or S-antigen, domain-containing protein [Cladophialophora immunda]|nr:Arrestin or S-antigen, domain-containing protein [Cladophialophora immunda]
MSLSISISNDDGKPFLPGSPVLGVVKLVTYDDQPIGELCITFRGRASVLLIHSYGDMTTSRKDYQSVGYLFSQHLNLYQGKYTHRKGSYMWPFAFCIPLSAAPRAVAPNSTDFFHAEHPWKNDRPLGSHPLPPSMSHGGRFHCSINYTLEATLAQPARTPLSLNKTLTASKDVKVQPLPSQIDWDLGDDWPYSNYRHRLQCTIKDKSEPSPRGLWSHLGDGLRGTKSNDRKRLEICISVRVPKRAFLTEQPLSLIISASACSIAKDCQPENVSLGNQLAIREFKISLWQHTHVRAGRHHSSSTRRVFVRKSSSRLVVSETPSLGSCPGADTQAQPGEVTATNLTDIADLSLPTSILVPDFSTYNIARSHSLEMTFKMQYVNKKFKFCLGNIPVRLLPAKCVPEGPTDMPPRSTSVSESELREGWTVFSPGEDLAIDDDVAHILLEEPPPQYRA